MDSTASKEGTKSVGGASTAAAESSRYGRGGGGGGGVAAQAALRFLALALTLAATLVMGLAKQTETVPIDVVPTLPALPVTITAKSTYSSAFKYFIIANAIVCAYSFLSLIASMATGHRKGASSLPISITDILSISLLFSSIGAAAAIGIVGRNGDPHTGWKKICNVYGKFCNHVTIAIILSLVGSFAYVTLMLFKLVSLHRRAATV